MIVYTFSTTSSFEEIVQALTEKNNKKRVKIGLNCGTTSYLDLHMNLTSWHFDREPDMDIQLDKVIENNTDCVNLIRVSFYWRGSSLESNLVTWKKSQWRIKLIRQLLKKYLHNFQEMPYLI